MEAVELFLNGGDDGPPKVVINTTLDLAEGVGDVLHSYGRLLNSGDLIPNELVDQLACDASRRMIIRIGERIVNVGDAKADLTNKQRLAVKTRDRGCTFRGCDRGPAWCHIHHLISRNKGGGNDLTNLTLLCGHHHRLIHATRWTVSRDPDTGLIETWWDGPTKERLTPEDLTRFRELLNPSR